MTLNNQSGVALLNEDSVNGDDDRGPFAFPGSGGAGRAD